jgi:hypothetical protein
VPANWWLTGGEPTNLYQPYDAAQSLSFDVISSERELAEIAGDLAGVDVDEGALEEWTAGEWTWQVLEPATTSTWSGIYALRRAAGRVFTVALEGIFLDREAAIRTLLLPALAEYRSGDAFLDPFQAVTFVDEESGATLHTVTPPDWVAVPDDPLAYNTVDGSTGVYVTFMGPEEIVANLAGELTGEEKPYIERIVVGERTWALFAAHDEGWSYLYAVNQDRRGTYLFSVVGEFYDVWSQGYDYAYPMMAGFSISRQ